MAQWDTNWPESKGRYKLPKQALNQLRAALSERCAAAGRTLPSEIKEIQKNSVIKSEWMSKFQDEITTLIPLYIDLDKYDNNFSGELYPTKWTETTIIKSIGDESTGRIANPASAAMSASWMFQQYKIINKLKIVQNTGSAGSGMEKAYESNTSWADAENNYLNNPDVLNISWSPLYEVYLSRYYSGAPYWDKGLKYYKTVYQLGALNRNVEIWLIAKRGVADLYENITGHAENVMWKDSTYMNKNNQLEIEGDGTIADTSLTNPQTAGSSAGSLGYKTENYALSNFSDYFEYKDW